MPKEEAPEFQWFVWTVFAIENWVLDFGRPIAMVSFKKPYLPNQAEIFIISIHLYLASISSGVVPIEQAKRWRLLPHGL